VVNRIQESLRQLKREAIRWRETIGGVYDARHDTTEPYLLENIRTHPAKMIKYPKE